MFALLFCFLTKKKSILETTKLRKISKSFECDNSDPKQAFLVGDNVQFTKHRQWIEAKIVYLCEHKAFLTKMSLDEEGNIIKQVPVKSQKKVISRQSEDQVSLYKKRKECIKSKDTAVKEFNEKLLKQKNVLNDETTVTLEESRPSFKDLSDDDAVVNYNADNKEEQKQNFKSLESTLPWFNITITADMILFQEHLLKNMKMTYELQLKNQKSVTSDALREKKPWHFDSNKVQISKNFDVWICPATLETLTQIYEKPEALMRKILLQFFSDQELAGYSAFGTGTKPAIPSDVFAAVTEYVTIKKGKFDAVKTINKAACNRAPKLVNLTSKNKEKNENSVTINKSLKHQHENKIVSNTKTRQKSQMPSTMCSYSYQNRSSSISDIEYQSDSDYDLTPKKNHAVHENASMNVSKINDSEQCSDENEITLKNDKSGKKSEDNSQLDMAIEVGSDHSLTPKKKHAVCDNGSINVSKINYKRQRSDKNKMTLKNDKSGKKSEDNSQLDMAIEVGSDHSLTPKKKHAVCDNGSINVSKINYKRQRSDKNKMTLKNNKSGKKPKDDLQLDMTNEVGSDDSLTPIKKHAGCDNGSINVSKINYNEQHSDKNKMTLKNNKSGKKPKDDLQLDMTNEVGSDDSLTPIKKHAGCDNGSINVSKINYNEQHSDKNKMTLKNNKSGKKPKDDLQLDMTNEVGSDDSLTPIKKHAVCDNGSINVSKINYKRQCSDKNKMTLKIDKTSQEPINSNKRKYSKSLSEDDLQLDMTNEVGSDDSLTPKKKHAVSDNGSINVSKIHHNGQHSDKDKITLTVGQSIQNTVVLHEQKQSNNLPECSTLKKNNTVQRVEEVSREFDNVYHKKGSLGTSTKVQDFLNVTRIDEIRTSTPAPTAKSYVNSQVVQPSPSTSQITTDTSDKISNLQNSFAPQLQNHYTGSAMYPSQTQHESSYSTYPSTSTNNQENSVLNYNHHQLAPSQNNYTHSAPVMYPYGNPHGPYYPRYPPTSTNNQENSVLNYNHHQLAPSQNNYTHSAPVMYPHTSTNNQENSVLNYNHHQLAPSQNNYIHPAPVMYPPQTQHVPFYPEHSPGPQQNHGEHSTQHNKSYYQL
ncbi:hypothetical protein HCN44_002608 [Aphidius gifuensis]|uniref:Uncharacterized protein n=1 Tax=Aphidius gifuensis TaxID=684658 RepID=A0A835CV01_APHGI|nr:hypothetical protein HCN44_002608 [Aphidius gifuensis]